MCVIIYKPEDKILTKRNLKQNWKANPDGGGFMYAENSQVIIEKGFMGFRSFWKRYNQVQHNKTVVVHFRIGTHGELSPINTQPFKVGACGFAHNGILHGLPADKVKSDSNLFAGMLEKTGLFNSTDSFEAMDVLLNSYAKSNSSKFAVMYPDGNVKLYNEKAGAWDDGVWYSSGIHTWGFSSYRFNGKLVKNTSITKYDGDTYDFDEYPYVVSNYLQQDNVSDEEWVECDFCGSWQPESETKMTQQGNVLCYQCAKKVKEIIC